MSDIKILFGGDLHKRSKDITTIEGYVQCNIAVQTDLINVIRNHNIDYFVSLGDWYDRGYNSDVSAALADNALDLEMCNVLRGNFYGVIGNHIRLNMDSNPELHLIQPHPVFKSRRPVYRREQIMRTPEVLRVGNVQISLMHYKISEESALDYKSRREPWAKFHIAVYHSEKIVPSAQLINTNYGYMASSNKDIAAALEGVDLAIVGHIHNPIGKFTVGLPYGMVTMIIPGSLTNVDAGENSRHSNIMMPLITVQDNDAVKMEFIPFDLKTNMVTFSKKNKEELQKKLKSLRGKGIESLHEAVPTVTYEHYEDVLLSLNAFMNVKGYTSKDKALVRSILSNPESLEELFKIYVDGGMIS